MSSDSMVILFCGVMAIIGSIIGYLLHRKDIQQERSILDLYKKHEDKSTQIQTLALNVASNYHDKNEIQGIVLSLKEFLNEKFRNVEEAIHGRRKSDGG